MKAQTPDGEIEIGNKCDRKIRPGGGSGFRIRIAPLAFPSHEIGVPRRQRLPDVDTNATDCFFTQIKHSVKYSRARMSSSVWPSVMKSNTDDYAVFSREKIRLNNAPAPTATATSTFHSHLNTPPFAIAATPPPTISPVNP